MEKIMISSKLKTIFGVSIPLFIAHGIEEYVVGFYDIDPYSLFVFRPFVEMSVNQATFLLFQVMVWLLLGISFLLISGAKWQSRLMFLPGLVYIFELHHIIKAIFAGGYYPGLITALGFPVIAFFFWRELWKELRHTQK